MVSTPVTVPITMLPRPHRLTRKQEFFAVMKRGKRAGTATLAAVVLPVIGHGPRWRCGFIVSKAVGNSVIRHRTTRRLRHAIAEVMNSETYLPATGSVDIVIRALPAAGQTDYHSLKQDLHSSLRRAMKKVPADSRES